VTSSQRSCRKRPKLRNHSLWNSPVQLSGAISIPWTAFHPCIRALVLFPQVRHVFRVDSHALVTVISHMPPMTLEDMGMDELELVPEKPYWVRAARIADALRKLADKLDDTPNWASYATRSRLRWTCWTICAPWTRWPTWARWICCST
jgi:hypothetical protein